MYENVIIYVKQRGNFTIFAIQLKDGFIIVKINQVYDNYF